MMMITMKTTIITAKIRRGGGGRGRKRGQVREQKDEEEEGMTIAELMDHIEKEYRGRSSLSSSSNRVRYSNNDNDYENDDAKVLVT